MSVVFKEFDIVMYKILRKKVQNKHSICSVLFLCEML